jgi:hypothetical protein
MARARVVVISQPMFFPWAGFFEQILASDAFVYYDDVQFSKGSFVNRVQIKTNAGVKWLTVPVMHRHLSQTISETMIDESKDWHSRHLAFLHQHLSDAPFYTDALGLVSALYKSEFRTIADLSVASINAVCTYLGIAEPAAFKYSSQLGVPGKGSQRVLDIVCKLGGTTYITGHGAAKYLDHEAFEQAGVGVEYMDYAKHPYPQLFGAFTPFVSILDLIANLGPAARKILCPRTVAWREFRQWMK